MTTDEFEALLDRLAVQLSQEAKNRHFDNSNDFERRVREVLAELSTTSDIEIDLEPAAGIFPDIPFGEFGIEVKYTMSDSWRSVANSILESTRDINVNHIYVMYAKMGGDPEVRWGRYEESVIHVRTSHVPRFELQIGAEESLFSKIGITYAEFSKLPIEEKMEYVRKYARARLKPGERLWWLEANPEQEHSLPIQARLYMQLSQEEKRKLRAEAALLCPQIVAGSRTKKKYDDVALYLLTYHGVLAPQARDMYSAGSVALRSDETRGGNYVMRALLDIENEMLEASEYLEDALFVEYWGVSVPPGNRIDEWLSRADSFASDWMPSEFLFRNRQKTK